MSKRLGCVFFNMVYVLRLAMDKEILETRNNIELGQTAYSQNDLLSLYVPAACERLI